MIVIKFNRKMVFDIRFKTSFTCIVNGQTGTGKTTWCRNLLLMKKHLFSTPPAKVFVFYVKYQDIYGDMLREKLVDEIFQCTADFPHLDDIYNTVHPYKENGGSLIIFDDLISTLSQDFENIFCNLSHHENASVIFISQNIFYQNKIFRTMSLNAQYLVLMKNERDKQQISILAKQICPYNKDFIIKAYEEATKQAFGYLILDFRSDTPSEIRVRSNIFPYQFPVKCYLER